MHASPRGAFAGTCPLPLRLTLATALLASGLCSCTTLFGTKHCSDKGTFAMPTAEPN